MVAYCLVCDVETRETLRVATTIFSSQVERFQVAYTESGGSRGGRTTVTLTLGRSIHGPSVKEVDLN